MRYATDDDDSSPAPAPAPAPAPRSILLLLPQLSMTVVLTAMNRFINEADGSQTAFIDGNQPERLCAPMVAHVEARGGAVRTGAPLAAIHVDDASGAVTALELASGERLDGFDAYVSALPVDVFKRLVPRRWSTMPFFRQFDALQVPVPSRLPSRHGSHPPTPWGPECLPLPAWIPPPYPMGSLVPGSLLARYHPPCDSRPPWYTTLPAWDTSLACSMGLSP